MESGDENNTGCVKREKKFLSGHFHRSSGCSRLVPDAGGHASRLRKAYVAATSIGVVEPRGRARHSEATAASRAANRALPHEVLVSH